MGWLLESIKSEMTLTAFNLFSHNMHHTYFVKRSISNLKHYNDQSSGEAGHSACSLGLSATSQQYFSLRTNQPPATSRNQPAVLFSQNKPAPAISHQPTEQADC
jgi:hypothetical protein